MDIEEVKENHNTVYTVNYCLEAVQVALDAKPAMRVYIFNHTMLKSLEKHLRQLQNVKKVIEAVKKLEG